jgi:PDZ domain
VRRARAFFLGLIVCAAPAAAATREAYEQNVVALNVTFQSWDEDRPWSKTRPGVRQISAVVVEGRHLLTAAQMVEDATFLQAFKFGRTSPSRPRIDFVDREVDLALLTVDDPSFFADLRPAPLAPFTPTEGTLRMVRWRNQQLESAASRVKRIMVEGSAYGRLEHPFLSVQTDLDGGGWADPVFQEGRLVGITISQDEQRARIIPVEVLSRFLERARQPDTYRAFPALGVLWQLNTDPAVTAWLGQEGEPRGILIRQVPWGSSGCGVLKPWDILLSIDGKAIDAEGFFAHPRHGQLRFPAIYVTDHAAGDVVPIQVLRERRVLDLKMTLRGYPVGLDLVPVRRGPQPPPYLIAGGLVFRELDAPYLRTWGRDWLSEAPLRLLSYYNLDQQGQTPERRRIILMKSVLPSPYTIGYHDLEDLPVESVNGVTVDSLEKVDQALQHPVNGFHTIRFAPNAFVRDIVLDASRLEEATRQILEEYRIPEAKRLPASPPPDPGTSCPGDY